MRDKTSVLALVGLPGSGKSSVAVRLGDHLDRKVLDTDKMVERLAGRSVSAIFADEGEAKFREMESRALISALREKNSVVSTGGGIILNPDNVEALRKGAYVVYLRASVELIVERTARRRHRPLLQGPDREERIRELWRVRHPLYEKAADLALDTEASLSVEDVSRRIERILSLLES